MLNALDLTEELTATATLASQKFVILEAENAEQQRQFCCYSAEIVAETKNICAGHGSSRFF